MAKRVGSIGGLLSSLDYSSIKQEGFSDKAIESFYDFLVEGKFTVDANHAISPDEFYWLLPLYHLTREQVVGKRDEDGRVIIPSIFKRGVVMRKASQMGASIWSILFIVWLCIDLEHPLNIGLFWPTKGDMEGFVLSRLNPLIRENPRLKYYMDMGEVDSTRAKQIGRSNLYLRYVEGESQSDSIPLDIIIADEVRLWTEPERTIQRIAERITQSKVGAQIAASTVGSPGDGMEKLWAESTQWKWFTYCPTNDCHTELNTDPTKEGRVATRDTVDAFNPLLTHRGVVISDYLPDKMTRYLSPTTATYVCPCCGTDIERVSNGYYVETRPEAMGYFGIEFAKTLLDQPFAMKRAFDTATDMKQMMNGWLAKPFRSVEGVLVSEEQWNNARSKEISWQSAHPGGGVETYMGVDFRTNEMHVIIGATNYLEGPARLIHVEQFQGGGWQERLTYLIDCYQITRGIIDYLPFTTETLKIANENDGTIYLAQYVTGKMIRLVTADTRGSRKINPDARERHKVSLDQLLAMKKALGGFASGNWILPAAPLIQTNFIDRKKVMHDYYDIVGGEDGKGREGLKDHLQCVSIGYRAKTTKNESKEVVNTLGNLEEYLWDAGGFDPHFAHTLTYMVMSTFLDGDGVELIGRTTQSEVEPEAPRDPIAASIRSRISLDQQRAGLRQKLCGNCAYFVPKDDDEQNRGRCNAIGYERRKDEAECFYGLYKRKANVLEF